MKAKEIVLKEIEKILKLLGTPGSLEIVSQKPLWLIRIQPQEKEDGRLLIGWRGANLNALEWLLRVILNKKLKEKCPRFVLDIAAYRAQKEEKLIALAHEVALKVKKRKKPMVLDPMSPSERRVVHLALAKIAGVVSESIGEGENRRVVVKPESG